MTGPDDQLTRPGRRSGMIWFVGLALVLLGALGVLVSGATLHDLTSHGEEGPVVALTATAVLLWTIEVISGVGVLAGGSWSRGTALIVCVGSVLCAAFLLINGAGPVLALFLLAHFVLLVALSGQKVDEWCG